MPMYNTSATRPTPDHRKPCTLCSKLCDVRVRCQLDESGTWHLICPGKCWKDVSGGVIDGDKSEEHKYYRYGGMWKNKHEAVSAKKPRKKSKEHRVETDDEGLEEVHENGTAGNAVENEWDGNGKKYTRNDEVMYEGELWICRKSHLSEEGKGPRETKNLWKEAVAWKEED
jgi:hypothetical protein